VSKSKLSNGKEVRVPAISVVTVPMLMRALGLCATWYAYTKEFDLVQIDPPSDLGTTSSAWSHPITAKLHALIAAWATDLRADRSYLTSELVAEAAEYLPSSSDRIRPALWDALFAIAGTKTGHLDVLRLGQWLHLKPVSKAAVFREFMAPLDLEEEIVARDAEVALAFLVEQGMVEVAGDTITVPASFWNGGQVPATWSPASGGCGWSSGGRIAARVAQVHCFLALNDPSNGGDFGLEWSSEDAQAVIIDDLDSSAANAKIRWLKIQQLHRLPTSVYGGTVRLSVRKRCRGR
jgi:hypothetical protein